MDTPSLPPSVATPATPPSRFHRILGILPTLSIRSKAANGLSIALLVYAAFSSASNAQDTSTSWDMSSASPAVTGTNIAGSAITGGNNNASTALLSNLSVSSGYSGASGAANAGVAARAGALNTVPSTGSAYFEVTLTPQNGATITLNALSMGSRSTGTGPLTYTVRTSVDSFVADLATGALLANGNWTLKTHTALSFTFSAATTFRIYGHGGTGGTAVNWRIDDLVFKTSSAGGVDTVSPTALVLSPPDNAVAVLVGNNLAVTYSENVLQVPGATGKIELRRTLDGSLIEEFSSSSPAITGYNTNTITINPSVDLPYLTEIYITIPAGFVEDSAGNDFAELSLATDWNFTTEAAPLPPSVVINKYHCRPTGRAQCFVSLESSRL